MSLNHCAHAEEAPKTLISGNPLTDAEPGNSCTQARGPIRAFGMRDLKQKSIRSGLAKLCSHAADLLIRAAFLVIMSRLLEPRDFGLVAMVTVVTGVYRLFVSAGLSEATIQAAAITERQLSQLFWVNVAFGAVLALACVLTAPLLVAFYDEPRLFWIAVAVGVGFAINAASVQHSALLQRQMRYVVLAIVETISQSAGFVVGVSMALAGFGYWAIVGGALASPVVYLICVWTATRWMPGLPRRDVQIRSMLRFGGTVTLTTLIVYFAYNFEKVLLGRFWGADILGLYGVAYQLINFPTGSLNAAVGGVMFSALSRIQDDPVRFRSYFFKAYTLVNSLTIPITMFSAVFADDIVAVCLGPKWTDAVPIFRLLSPTIMIFGIINPTGWLLLSLGLYGRSFRIALVIAPLVITSYLVGLPYGPTGVATAFSSAMMLWVVPHIFWCTRGTPISPRGIGRAISTPLLSALCAGAISETLDYVTQLPVPLWRFALVAGTFTIIYAFLLLVVAGQGKLYLDLVRGLRGSSSATESDHRSGFSTSSSAEGHKPMKLRAGDWVEVRSKEEILATLDKNGGLDALPFMPEMLRHVGRRYRVARRVDKICDTIARTGSRRMHATVYLAGLRCDGAGHGGCQAGCMLYWKEAWLRRVDDGACTADTIGADGAALEHLAQTGTRTVRELEGAPCAVWRCQATEAFKASKPLKVSDPRQYWRELTNGNFGPLRLVGLLARGVIMEIASRVGALKPLPLRGPGDHSAPAELLDLKPGEVVQVRHPAEIVHTLDENGLNRGLSFDREMLPYCGRTFRVKDRVRQIIDDKTGRMIKIPKDCVILDDVVCSGERSTGRWFCPRQIYPFWREAWLRRVESSQ
jgi:O-antigen/teichoic acid export membrane protein